MFRQESNNIDDLGVQQITIFYIFEINLTQNLLI